MFSVGTQLNSESELKRGKLAQVPVLVKYKDGEIAEYGGPIEEITAEAVKINGTYYTKAACLFYIR